MNENTLSNIQRTEITGFENIQKIDPVDFSYTDSRAVKMHFQQTFENQRTKDGKYESCHFESCKFRSTGFSGTQFINCRLEDCAIEDSNLQFCGFSKKTKIYGENGGHIISSNLSHSSFVNVELNNVTLKSTTFSQARMINSKLHRVTFDSCTLQNNVFINMVMDDVSLIGCNLEYSDFVNIKFINAKLPFHQIAYTYGLLEALEEQSEQIIVGAKSSGKIVSGQDYLRLLPEFLSYYVKIKEYFPVINILIYLKDYNLAEEYINLAFQKYIRDNNFRKLREICKLVANHR